MPTAAGTQRGRIFGDLYDSIFNDDLTAEKLLVPLQVFKPIEERKRELRASIRKGIEYDSDMLFLIDGAYHMLYAIGLLCDLTDNDKSDVDSAISQLDDAIAVVQAAVREEEKDPAFALKRFFKSARAEKYILQAAYDLVDSS